MYMENNSTSGEDGPDLHEMILGELASSVPDDEPATSDDPLQRLASEGGPLLRVVDLSDSLRLLPHRLELGGPVPSPRQPGPVARLLALLLANGGVHVKHWRDQWYVWREQRTGGRYAPLDGADNRYAVPDAIRAVLEDATYEKHTDKGPEPCPWNPNTASVREVAEALAAASRPHDGMASGTWIGADASEREAETPGREITCVSNGLLWCPAEGGAASRRLLPHTPSFFTTAAVAVPYIEDAACPRWSAFLGELWPDDEDSQALLQEWFGYVLAGSTELHKILTLVGPKRSGKSTIAWVLETLLGGAGQVDHPTMARLAEPFGLAPMLGKRLAVVGDARIGKSDNAVVEKLLMISGEDPVTVNRKNRDELSVRMDARIMIISNSMPDLRDTTGALASRFLPLSIKIEGFLGREDFGLKHALSGELPGILGWAIEGADRLWEREGRFTIGHAVRESMIEVERSSSPIRAFAADCLVFGVSEDTYALKDDVHAAYEVWSQDAGYGVKGKNVFFRDLLSAYPGELSTGKNTIGGRQRPVLRGARLGSEK